MSIEAGLIAIIGVLLSGATFFVGRQTSAKGEGKEEGAREARLEACERDLKELKGQRDSASRVTLDIDKRVTRVEENLAYIRTKADELCERLEKIEDRLTKGR